jgi:hypothetical protein
MAPMTLEWQGNRPEDAQGVGAGLGRMVRVRRLALCVNADELALRDQAFANSWVDIAEHAERLPPLASGPATTPPVMQVPVRPEIPC